MLWLALLSCGSVLAVPWTPSHGALTPGSTKTHRTHGGFDVQSNSVHASKRHSSGNAEPTGADEDGAISASPATVAIILVCVVVVPGF